MRHKYITITSILLIVMGVVGVTALGVYETALNTTIKKANAEISKAKNLLNDGLIQYEQANSLKVEIQELNNVKATRNKEAITYETQTLAKLNKRIKKLDAQFDDNLNRLYNAVFKAKQLLKNKNVSKQNRQLLKKVLRTVPGRPIAADPTEVTKLVKELNGLNQKITNTLT